MGVATDNDANIRAYAVTPDSSDPTKCTITVNEVEGAKAYYVLFKGSLGADGDATKESAANDFSAISFDTATKTFTGLKVGNQQVDKNSLNSHIWYTSGYPLSMVGKADGTSLVMKPCLALVKVQIAEQSVPADNYVEIDYTSSKNIVHTHGYSAVRGFNLYQKGSSTIYSSGDYTVQVADNGDISVNAVINDNKKEYRQISQSDHLVKGTDYLMCLIPGGDITSFKFDFLGYKEDSSLSWDAVYTMTHSESINVAPGDFYDFGVLNPLGRKIAKNEAADEVEDAQPAFVPAIKIDGTFSDWEGITEYSGTRTSGSSNSRILGWKLTGDTKNIYVYLKLANEKFAVSGTNKPNSYIYVCFDTDNNDSTGDTRTSIPGVDQYAVIYPCVKDSDPASFIQGVDPRSTINGSSDGTLETWGVFDTVNTAYSHVELCVPRAKLSGLPASGNSIKVGVSFQDYDAQKQSITLE